MKNLIKLYQEKLLAVKLDQNGKMGVENVKMVLAVVVTFFTEIIIALRDRNYLQIASIIFNLFRVGNIIAMAQVAWLELKDMSEDEAREVNAHFAAVFDIENDVLEATIERAVAVVPAVYELVGDVLDVWARGRNILAEIQAIFAKADPDAPVEA